MSPPETKWLRSWSVESDDDNNPIENIPSPPTSLMVSPFQYFDDEIYNTTPHFPSTVSSFQTIIDEAIMDETFSTTSFYPLIASPLQTLDDKTHNITSPSTLEVEPFQTVDGENHNTKTPPPALEAPPIPTVDGETHKTEPHLPTLETTFLQTVDNNINNTPPPPPPPMVPSLQAIVPYETNKDSIAAADGPPPPMVSSLQAIVPYETNKDSIAAADGPPPPMVSPLQAILPYETNEDSIAATDGPSSDAIKRKRGRPRGSKNLKMSIKKTKPYDPNSKVVTYCPSFDSGISEAERETGNKEVADSVLMQFDAVRRRLCQLKSVKGPSLLTTALTSCKNLGVRTNTEKIIGSVPGVNVGDIFYYWGEMCLVGLHMPMVAGIDYLTIKDGATEGPLATSVVTSGHYNDETEDLDTLIYTGHGGQAADQKLGRGNLALKESKLMGNEVRVIRGEEDPNNKNKKIYIYDGLYIVSDSWTAKGKSGFEEFKFKLLRRPDQPAAYANWKSSKNWSKCMDDNSRKGLILHDLSHGAEILPVPLVNDIDDNDKEMPREFSYVRASTCSGMMIVQNYQSTACIDCHDVQLCEDPKCVCVQRNGGELPYHKGILVCRKSMVYECGDTCPCPPGCHNRVTQTGLKIRVEVFKTEKCGWGLRSLEPIRAGTFICELVGMAKRNGVDEDDEYVFDSSRVYNQFKWNYEPELVGEDCWDQVSEAYELRWQMVVSSKEYGNVSRFMNHSCSPNVMWQPIEFEDSRQPCVRIAFFAMKHIPPLTELRYDYGMSCKTDEVGEDWGRIFKGKKICHCGSVKCQGSFG